MGKPKRASGKLTKVATNKNAVVKPKPRRPKIDFTSPDIISKQIVALQCVLRDLLKRVEELTDDVDYLLDEAEGKEPTQ